MNNRGSNIVIGLWIVYGLVSIVMYLLGKVDLKFLLYATPIVILGILAQWVSKRNRAKTMKQG